MLQIVEQTPVRLVLQDRRPRAAIAAGAVAVLSGLMVISLSLLGVQRLIGTNVDYPLVRGFGLIVFLLFALALALIGGMATLSFAHGISCVFDRENEAFVIRRINLFRPQEIRHSIYGIERLDIERNDEVRAFGLFIVLKSGERVPMAAISMLDEDHMQHLAQQIRAFLRGG